MYDYLDDDDVREDYFQLLRRSGVSRDLAPDIHPQWRAAIKARARADKVRIRTYSVTEGPAGRVYAVLPDRPLTLEEIAEAMRSIEWGEGLDLDDPPGGQ